MAKVYIVMNGNIGLVTGVFATKELAQRAIQITGMKYFYITEWEVRE